MGGGEEWVHKTAFPPDQISSAQRFVKNIHRNTKATQPNPQVFPYLSVPHTVYLCIVQSKKPKPLNTPIYGTPSGSCFRATGLPRSPI